MTDLRAALTHALLPHLPPEHVATVADAIVANGIGNPASSEWVQAAAKGALALLPSPYAEAAQLVACIAGVVQDYWAASPNEVVAESVTITDFRA